MTILKHPSCGGRLRWTAFAVLAVVAMLAAFLLIGCRPVDQPTFAPTAAETIPPSATPSSTPAPPTTVPPPPSPSPIPTHTPTPSPAASPTPSPTPGQVVFGEQNTDRYVLDYGALRHPHGLILIGDSAYLLDTGQLVVVSLEGGRANRLTPLDGLIEGFPVGEMINLALSPDEESLLLLDKRGDLYRYAPLGDNWSIERPIDRRRSAPNPVPCAVDSYNERAYLLDMTYSQVWRHPYGGDVDEGYLPGGDAPGNRLGTGLDISRGIDLAVHRDVYVLLREGHNEQAGLVRFVGAPGQRDESFAADLAVEKPNRLFLDPEGEGPLYLIDQDGRRLRALDLQTGEVLQTLTFRDDMVEMRAVYATAGRLYIAALDTLYLYPGTGQVHTLAGGVGPDPAQRLDDPQRLASLPSLTLPISGVRFIPERASLLPGSPRVYRYGIHHGFDFYGGTMGTDIPYGSPVRTVADGIVIRADHGYQEMTPIEWDELAAICEQLHMTPSEIEDRFRGRQVWVDHGDGVTTRYVHLAGIPEEIVTGTVVTQGQIIGYVGNSGTSEGAAGSQSGGHLHFELRLGGHYLGEGLSIVEVRRLLQRIFPFQ